MYSSIWSGDGHVHAHVASFYFPVPHLRLRRLMATLDVNLWATHTYCSVNALAI